MDLEEHRLPGSTSTHISTMRSLNRLGRDHQHDRPSRIVLYPTGLPLVSARRANPSGWQFAVKHTCDRLVAGMLLVAALPLLAVLALGVALSDGQPIFFRQRRIGRDG
jgi:lipopolysaccharide/colanic/teichoic acid biosynthesis glycosyltransferase